jgi:phosphate transport system permease protein
MSLRQASSPNYRVRKLIDRCMRGMTIGATLLALIPLVLIIGYVTIIGGGALSADFFTKTYEPPDTGGFDFAIPSGEEGAAIDPNDPFAGIDLGNLTGDGAAVAEEPGAASDGVVDIAGAEARGGVLHGIIGTLLITGLALFFSLPIGIFAGIFLAEFPQNPLATFVRFATDVLSGAPSIIAGVTIYLLVVVAFREFSGVAGSLALTILMVPTVTRTTEEVLKLVPESTREAALALGAPQWYSTFTVVIPTALTGIVTGVMLAFARGAGETAPLILTVLGSNVISFDIFAPLAALPLITYRYTESPYPSENALAWGSAFVLMMLVLVMNILVRLATRSRVGGR